jgi:hypothetical protein
LRAGLVDVVADEDPAALTQQLTDMQAEKETLIVQYRQQKKQVDEQKDLLQGLIASMHINLSSP